ncbi:MAG: S41 family peptidase [Pirellulales bacterium]
MMHGQWNAATSWRNWRMSLLATIVVCLTGAGGLNPVWADEPEKIPAASGDEIPAAPGPETAQAASELAEGKPADGDPSEDVPVTATVIDPATQAAADEYYQLLRDFADAVDQVERNYVREISRKELMEAAINGVLSKLDEYSDFIPEDQVEGFQKEVKNKFEGIGVQIAVDPQTQRIRVISPLIGSPAYRAGVLAGDMIVKVDGEELKEVVLSDVIRRLQGPPGSKVVVTVTRATEPNPIDIPIERGEVRVETVLGYARQPDDSWDFFCDPRRKLGYVRISAFADHTPEELQRALEQLKKQQMAGLVLDLRFNPGGILNSAVETADLFLESGVIVSAEGRNVAKRIWEARREGTFDGFPMAVLVNHYSASASEIVAASLQDHDRAVVIGERTWGKGSVQNLVELEGGRGAIKLTTASYLRPSGKNIHRFANATETDEWGVRPNDGFDVMMRPGEQVRWLEWRKSRDISHGTPAGTGKDRGQGTREAESDRVADPQLDKAISYLTGKLGK